MYFACRHIKPNGLRCKSPAIRGTLFCYLHARLHRSSGVSTMDDLNLPFPEDPAAIQLSVKQIFEALASSRIDGKCAGLLLYGLQIASMNIQRKSAPPLESVESVMRTTEGEELAPELRICNAPGECTGCTHAETCPSRASKAAAEDAAVAANESAKGKQATKEEGNSRTNQ